MSFISTLIANINLLFTKKVKSINAIPVADDPTNSADITLQKHDYVSMYFIKYTLYMENCINLSLCANSF
jgi:hypothetical protein